MDVLRETPKVRRKDKNVNSSYTEGEKETRKNERVKDGKREKKRRNNQGRKDEKRKEKWRKEGEKTRQ